MHPLGHIGPYQVAQLMCGDLHNQLVPALSIKGFLYLVNKSSSFSSQSITFQLIRRLGLSVYWISKHSILPFNYLFHTLSSFTAGPFSTSLSFFYIHMPHLKLHTRFVLYKPLTIVTLTFTSLRYIHRHVKLHTRGSAGRPYATARARFKIMIKGIRMNMIMERQYAGGD